MKLTEAIETLATTHLALDIVARGLIVDPAEVYAELQKAEAGSMEELCLQQLAKYNPYTPPKKKETKAE
jgi:hypothetical protein